MAVTVKADGLVLAEAGDTYTLPTGKAGNSYRIVNITGTGVVTVATTGGQTINGQVTQIVGPRGDLLVAWNDTEWSVLSLPSSKVFVTPEGGLAVRLTNKTGGASVKGYMVHTSAAQDNAVALGVVDVPDPVGFMYEAGVADGAECLIVVAGIADVYFTGNTTRGYLARGYLTADGAGYVAGQCLAEAFPSPPFSSDRHFYEVGHVLESRVGAGLAKCLIHFN